jgi:integrase
MPKKEPKKDRGVFERPAESGVWWICYFDQYGLKHRECVGMKSTALKVYQQRKTEIRHGKFDPEDIKRKHQNATVADIIEDYLKACEANARRSLRDIQQRGGWWKDRYGQRAANSIIKDDIENARLELARGRFLGFRHKVDKEKAEKHRSTATVNRYLATFKSAFLLAIENEKVTKNPFRKVKLQKENNTRTSTRVRFLTEDEEARLFKVIPSQWHAPVLVALHTGMRFGEQMRLRWEDIDFKQELLTVMESKSGSARHVPLKSDCRQHLACNSSKA